MTSADVELLYILVHISLYFVLMQHPSAWMLHALAFIGYLIAHHW